MLKEQNPLINLNFEKKSMFISNTLELIYEGLYELYRFILEDPFENFWFECIGIILGYAQIILYLVDKTVNK
jgi:hypothetical protein